MRKLFLLFALLCFTAWTGWYYHYLYRGNFGTVIPGEIYRSGQLGPDQLKKVLAVFEIKSIINLRGFKGEEDWFVKEKEIAEKAGVGLYNATELGIELQSYRLPARVEVEKLIKMIATVPRPVLVHCSKGADRTGLFSALTVLLGKNSRLDQAWKHSSFKYLAIDESAGSQFLQSYQDWLGGRMHDPSLLLHWLEQEYLPHYYKVRIQAVDPPEVVKDGDTALFRVRVINESPETIPLRFSRAEGVRLGGHFYKKENQKLSEYQVLRGKPIHTDLKPGDSVELELDVPTGLQPGQYVLTFDLIDEYSWFNAKGSPTETVEFSVKS